MQLNSIKTAADLPFKGIELVKTDSTITEVIIGGKLRVRTDGYGSGLKVLVEAAGERVKRHRVTATIEGFGDKVEFHESSYEAASAVSKLEALGAKAEASEVSVVIDAFGAVVETAETHAEPVLCDLPF